MGTQLVELNESPRSKKIRKCSKTMPKGPLVGRWNMCKNANLKESIESSKFELGWKFYKESKQGDYVSSGCKASNAITIFKDVKTRARRARTLVTRVNSSAHPRAKLQPREQGGGGGDHKGRIKTKKIKIKIECVPQYFCTQLIPHEGEKKTPKEQ